MSGVKLVLSLEQWIEVQAECQACGSGLLADAGLGAWQDRSYGAGKRIVVKVRPCARCAREAAEQKQINGASIHTEGVRS